jgi:hypothetical protein
MGISSPIAGESRESGGIRRYQKISEDIRRYQKISKEIKRNQNRPKRSGGRRMNQADAEKSKQDEKITKC